MKTSRWSQFTALAAGVLTALSMSSTAFAQESLEQRLERLEKQNDDIRKNAEALQKQNDELMRLLKSGSVTTNADAANTAAPLAVEDVRTIVSTYLQEKEVQQKAAEVAACPEGDGRYKIGSDLRMSASWKNGLVLATPNNDFSLHVGGWIQYDNVWWNQSAGLITKQGANGKQPGIGSGVGSGGIGSLEDGTYFRRVRLQTDGKFWENYEYILTLALENIQAGTVGLDEFWVGATNIPVLGTIRFGHVKNAIGIEADMSGSSKVMTFLERSSYSEAIERNENFVTGVWMGNNYLDQRTTWSGVIFRPDLGAATGAFFGNNQWAAQGRLTALPLYEIDGRHLLHLGLSGGWRSGTTNNAVSSIRGVDLRARPELRDDDPAGSAGLPQVVANANSTRMIDTGNIACSNDFLLGTEVLYILGPASFQAEYGWNYMQDATGVVSSTGVFTPFPQHQSYVFSGGYVQLAYTLTGENRSYDKRLGRLDSYYFGRQGNFSNAWFVRDENGCLNWSLGAWEVAARYSYVNLNDGAGLNRIQGGIMTGLALGLNWYLNDNFKAQLDYVFDHRYDVPGATVPGSTRGVGARVQFNY